MAEPLNTGIAKSAIRGGFLSGILALSPLVFAETLADPTRPAAVTGLAQETHAAVAESGPVLQSVLVSPRRKVAVISGKEVSIGGKFGDSRVIKITESEVTLLNGKKLQTLKLFPGMEKRPASNETRPQADSRRQ